MTDDEVQKLFGEVRAMLGFYRNELFDLHAIIIRHGNREVVAAASAHLQASEARFDAARGTASETRH